MTDIDTAVNAARIGFEIEDTSNLEVFTEAAAAGKVLAALENSDGFLWDNQREDWETTCAAIAAKIDSLLSDDDPVDWNVWLTSYLAKPAPEFVPDNKETLRLGEAFYAATAPFFHFLQVEARAKPDGVAATLYQKLEELYPAYEALKEFVEDDLREAAKKDEVPPCSCTRCRVRRRMEELGLTAEYVRGALSAPAGQPKPGWLGEAGDILLKEMQKIRTAEAAPKADLKVAGAGAPAPNPKEAAVKGGKGGPTIKLSGSLAEAWLNDPTNKAIVEKYAAKQAQQ